MNSKNKLPWFEIALVAIGEAVISLIIIGVFVIIGKFDMGVLFGTLLGSAVVLLNFIWLSVSVNRAIDRIMAERGDGEMDDEAAKKFAEEHSAAIQNAAKLSYIIRTLSTLAALVLAFLLDFFNVIATLIPLLMLRPILTVGELIRRRCDKK